MSNFKIAWMMILLQNQRRWSVKEESLLNWKENIKNRLINMTVTRHFGMASLLSLNSKETNTREILMMLKWNSNKLLSNYKDNKMMERASQKRLLTRCLCNRKPNTLKDLKNSRKKQIRLCKSILLEWKLSREKTNFLQRSLNWVAGPNKLNKSTLHRN